MHFLKILLTIASISLLLLRSAFSQQEVELTLKTSVDNAVKNNPQVTKVLNSIEGQQSVVRTRYGDLFPTLSFTGGWTRTNQITKGGFYNFNGIQIPIGTKNETTNNYSLALRSDVTLFNGMGNYESIDAARMTEENLYVQLEKTKQDIVLKILGDYIAALKNLQILRINTASLEDSRAQLERIKLFVEAGRRTMSDVYSQDVIVAQNELAVEQARNNLDKSIADLVYDASLRQEVSYTVVPREFTTDVSFENLQRYVNQNSNVDQLVNTALENRYDYLYSANNVSIFETNLEITRSSVLFPTLSGFGSYSLSGQNLNKISDSRVFTIGLTLSYPIFQGFSIENQRQQALVNLKSANEDLRLVRDKISLDIKKAVLDLKSLLKQIEITERNIKAAQQDKFLAEESYKVGLGTLLEIQTATTKYNNALIDKSNLIYNFLLAQKQMEYYQGLLKY
jgi:outer membrane protein